MKYLITDYDGVLIRTEFAKAAGWYIAALYMRDVLDSKLIEGLKSGLEDAISIVERDCEEQKEIEKVTALAGMSQDATRDAVADLFLEKEYERYGKEQTREKLREIRNGIKNVIINAMGRPIEGNIKFFREARKSGLELGLVTQTTSKDVVEQGKRFSDLHIDMFSYMECAGDEFYKKMGKDDGYRPRIDKKAVAYACICKRMNINPFETVAFEDSASGIDAANAVGIVSIGVKDECNTQ
ncbi:HAD hydrolase-like protein, partial [Candidatus Pacearchaeota archaeon]|nr:HAD hydrolase-like protein [Candidatus Pacearchaeota archaeon]